MKERIGKQGHIKGVRKDSHRYRERHYQSRGIKIHKETGSMRERWRQVGRKRKMGYKRILKRRRQGKC